MRQCVFYGGQLPAHAIRSALGIEILLDFLRRRFDPPPKSFPDGSLKFLSPYTAYSLLTTATVCVCFLSSLFVALPFWKMTIKVLHHQRRMMMVLFRPRIHWFWLLSTVHYSVQLVADFCSLDANDAFPSQSYFHIVNPSIPTINDLALIFIFITNMYIYIHVCVCCCCCEDIYIYINV